MKNVLVVHGPNLNLLGTREPEIYGSTTLAELEHRSPSWATELGLNVRFFQSNHEGALIDALHAARGQSTRILINAGALTHYSYALARRAGAVDKVTVEVHISNIHAREPWRANSVTALPPITLIYGRGLRGYQDGLRRIARQRHVPDERLHTEPPSQYGELRCRRRWTASRGGAASRRLLARRVDARPDGRLADRPAAAMAGRPGTSNTAGWEPVAAGRPRWMMSVPLRPPATIAGLEPRPRQSWRP